MVTHSKKDNVPHVSGLIQFDSPILKKDYQTLHSIMDDFDLTCYDYHEDKEFKPLDYLDKYPFEENEMNFFSFPKKSNASMTLSPSGKILAMGSEDDVTSFPLESFMERIFISFDSAIFGYLDLNGDPPPKLESMISSGVIEYLFKKMYVHSRFLKSTDFKNLKKISKNKYVISLTDGFNDEVSMNKINGVLEILNSQNKKLKIYSAKNNPIC